MKLSNRETMLAWATGLVVLAGVTYLFCEPKVKEIVRLRGEQAKVQEKIDLTGRMVAQKGSWKTRLDELTKGLPEFPADKDATADLLITLDRIASDCKLKLPRREAEPEKKHGEVSQMSINYKWEGSLDALVHFLFQLQEQGAMLDLSQLSISPEKGVLKGGFTVDCAYRRAGGAPAASAAKTPPKGR